MRLAKAHFNERAAISNEGGRVRVTATAAVPYGALPEPMLAKTGKLPTRGAWAYEVKWDGFRAIVSTEGPLRVRSRRGWNMTEHVQFLEQLPVQAILDGELVAFGEDGKPDFERVCMRMLHRHDDIRLVFIAFDVLSVEGEDVRAEPYRQRRRFLEELRLDGAAVEDARVIRRRRGTVGRRLRTRARGRRGEAVARALSAR